MSKANEDDMTRKNKTLHALFEEGAFKYKIPYRMQETRSNAHISQKQMAQLLGVSKTYISNIENGRTKLPADILLGYCKILKVPPEHFLKYTGDNPELPEGYLALSEEAKALIREMITLLNQQSLNTGQ